MIEHGSRATLAVKCNVRENHARPRFKADGLYIVVYAFQYLAYRWVVFVLRGSQGGYAFEITACRSGLARVVILTAQHGRLHEAGVATDRGS